LGCLFVSGCLIAATCTGPRQRREVLVIGNLATFRRKISVSGIAAGDARKARAAGLAGATARPSGYSNTRSIHAAEDDFSVAERVAETL
jgi:hypothetical protein